MAFNNARYTAVARLLWNIDCFQENSPFDISPISKEQHRTLLPKGREKYIESISTLTSPADCNCCYVDAPVHTEHCVQAMKEQSISYYSAHLSVCNTLPVNQAEWLEIKRCSPNFTSKCARAVLAPWKQIKRKNNGDSQIRAIRAGPSVCETERSCFEYCRDQVANQHQVWNETQVPEEAAVGSVL